VDYFISIVESNLVLRQPVGQGKGRKKTKKGKEERQEKTRYGKLEGLKTLMKTSC